MRKYFLVSLFALFIYLVFPQNTFAQNTFGCTHTAGLCVVQSGDSCLNGYLPNFQTCANFNNNPQGCNARRSEDCVPDPNNSNKFRCVSGACEQCAVGDTDPRCNLNGIATCRANCGSTTTVPPATGTGVKCGGQDGTINTAIGCIPIGSMTELVGFFLRWGVGIGGGIAFLLMVYAGFIIMTSTGNPERLKAGQELLTSAISGLIMLLFSIFILRLIGVEILQIPGFGA